MSVCLYICSIFLYNHLLFVMITQVLVQTFTTRGKNNQFNQLLLCHDYPSLTTRENNNGGPLPVSQLEHAQVIINDCKNCDQPNAEYHNKFCFSSYFPCITLLIYVVVLIIQLIAVFYNLLVLSTFNR